MPKITEMYAFVMEDADEEDEGVMGMSMGEWMLPLVGADMSRVDSLRPHADKIAEAAGKPYKILRFSQREDITDGYTKLQS
jgi:hypothetical protein